jgi:hypothetical protein
LLIANLIGSILYSNKERIAEPEENSTEKDMHRENNYKESKVDIRSQFDKQPAEENQDQPDMERSDPKKQGRLSSKLDDSIFKKKKSTITIAL